MKRDDLCNRMLNLLIKKPYSANRNHVNAIERKIKEMDSKTVRPNNE